MPSILLANKNLGGNTGRGTSADSGNISAQAKSGVAPGKLTTGIQQQATQAMQADSTTGQAGNFIPTVSPSSIPVAKITNIAVSTTNGVSTATVTAVNTFLVGQTVRFAGLTAAPQLNTFAGVVTSTGLSASGFQCTITGYVATTVGSAAETGTATVNFYGKQAALSLAPNN